MTQTKNKILLILGAGLTVLAFSFFFFWFQQGKPVFALTPSVTVLSPNGGEIWQRGTTKTVSWSLANVPLDGSIRLFLRKTGMSDTVFAIINSSTTSFDWTISPFTVAGIDYKVVVAVRNRAGGYIAIDESDGFFSINVASACNQHNLEGWAWSETIGWISFSCKNQNPNIDYGVDFDSISGLLSGYAWSEHLGWISFNQSDLAGCPSGACEARLASGNLNGWARVYRAIVGGGQTLGGFEGWIKLSGTGYGVTLENTIPDPDEFLGWVWGGDSNDINEAVTGWISFNCRNQGVCASSNYKVYLAQLGPVPPVISLTCSNSNNPPACQGVSGQSSGVGALTINYSATDLNGNLDISTCDFRIDGITRSAACSGSFLATGEGIGSHTASMSASDTGGLSSTQSLSFIIISGGAALITADFLCSLDNEDFSAPCDVIEPAKNTWVYFRDNSTPSSGAAISSCSWIFQNGSPAAGNICQPKTKFTQAGLNNVTLTVTDTLDNTASVTKAIRTLSGEPIEF